LPSTLRLHAWHIGIGIALAAFGYIIFWAIKYPITQKTRDTPVGGFPKLTTKPKYKVIAIKKPTPKHISAFFMFLLYPSQYCHKVESGISKYAE